MKRELGGEGREAKEEGRRESRQRRNSLVGFDSPFPPRFQGREETTCKGTIWTVFMFMMTSTESSSLNHEMVENFFWSKALYFSTQVLSGAACLKPD